METENLDIRILNLRPMYIKGYMSYVFHILFTESYSNALLCI